MSPETATKTKPMSRAETQERIAELEADRATTKAELDALPEKEREAIKQRFLSRQQVFGVLHSSVTDIAKERTRLEKRLENLDKALAVARDVLVDLDAAEREKAQKQALAAAKNAKRLEQEVFAKAANAAAEVMRIFEEYVNIVEDLDDLRRGHAGLFAHTSESESEWRVATEPNTPVAGYPTYFFERVAGARGRSPEISGDIPVKRRPSGMPAPGARGTAREQKAGFPGLVPEGYHVSEGWGEG
jgi:hypothetical protein